MIQTWQWDGWQVPREVSVASHVYVLRQHVIRHVGLWEACKGKGVRAGGRLSK